MWVASHGKCSGRQVIRMQCHWLFATHFAVVDVDDLFIAPLLQVRVRSGWTHALVASPLAKLLGTVLCFVCKDKYDRMMFKEPSGPSFSHLHHLLSEPRGAASNLKDVHSWLQVFFQYTLEPGPALVPASGCLAVQMSAQDDMSWTKLTHEKSTHISFVVVHAQGTHQSNAEGSRE